MFLYAESQPTNYLIGAQANPVGVRYPQPPPPPPGGWPAPPPPPVGPPPTPNDCTDPGSPLGGCPDNFAQSVYLASTSTFFFLCVFGESCVNFGFDLIKSKVIIIVSISHRL